MGSQILQQMINGLALGCVYGLITLGYSMVYGVLEMLNFAQDKLLPPALVLTLMMVGAMIGCGVLGVGIEFLAYRPIRNAPRLAPLISALAMSIFLENFVALTLGARAKNYSTELLIPINWQWTFLGVQVSFVRILLIVLSIGFMIALDIFVRRTRFGKAMRATNNDRIGASYQGISINFIISLTFLIGSMLAGAAGVLVGLYYTQIDFFMGFTAGFKAFTAAVLGGIGNLRGAMVGGIVLGMAESIGIAFISPTYKDVIALVLLILLLLVKPSGLLGEQLPQKV